VTPRDIGNPRARKLRLGDNPQLVLCFGVQF
jgi:hypothetical protein